MKSLITYINEGYHKACAEDLKRKCKNKFTISSDKAFKRYTKDGVTTIDSWANSNNDDVYTLRNYLVAKWQYFDEKFDFVVKVTYNQHRSQGRGFTKVGMFPVFEFNLSDVLNKKLINYNPWKDGNSGWSLMSKEDRDSMDNFA